ncbi:hypothetical protein HYU92_03435 [Candidatus Curtissbacteria bacterium]|nr:hypothetical protein [Candidatus Curtissbacteria bacterium]
MRRASPIIYGRESFSGKAGSGLSVLTRFLCRHVDDVRTFYFENKLPRANSDSTELIVEVPRYSSGLAGLKSMFSLRFIRGLRVHGIREVENKITFKKQVFVV